MSEHFVPRSLRRMNSNPKKKSSDDTESLFIAGNLDQVPKQIEDIYTDDEDFEEEEEPVDGSMLNIRKLICLRRLIICCFNIME